MSTKEAAPPKPNAAWYKKPLFIVAIVAVVVVASVLGLYASPSFHITSSSSPNPCTALMKENGSAPGIANESSSNSTAYFTIIESDPGSIYEGMNGSAYHMSTQWPVLEVEQGQNVVIHVYNCASSESHGFSITHYFNSGVAVAPGQSYILGFTADQAGDFRVFCSIFCAIHPLMQNGELIVTPK